MPLIKLEHMLQEQTPIPVSMNLEVIFFLLVVNCTSILVVWFFYGIFPIQNLKFLILQKIKSYHNSFYNITGKWTLHFSLNIFGNEEYLTLKAVLF